MGKRGIQNEVAVDFIGNEQEVVFDDKRGEAIKLLPSPHAGDGVVRITQVEHFGLGCNGGSQGIPVDDPAAVGESPRGAHGAAFEVTTGGEEGGIDGGEGEVVVACFGEGESGEIEAADHAGEPDDPVVFDSPTIVGGEVFTDGVESRRHRTSVAKDALFDAGVQGGDDGGGCLKIHIGHPHGEDIATGILLPFLSVGFLTSRRSGEVEGHGNSRCKRPDVGREL